MVHQLLLVSKIPHNSYVQTVSTLQALTGLVSPQTISTYTLVTRPHDIFKPKAEAGKVNQIEQHFMKCTTTWTDIASDNLDISQAIIKDQSDISVDRLFLGDDTSRNWTLQIADIPVAGRNQVCSAQTIYESTLVHHHTGVRENGKVEEEKAEKKAEEKKPEEKKAEAKVEQKKAEEKRADNKAEENSEEKTDKMDVDVKTEEDGIAAAAATAADDIHQNSKKRDSFLQFLEDLGYDVVNQYWLSGIRFFHGDIVIEIFKVFIRDDEDKSPAENKIKLKLLDESNAFQIKTYINVPKSTDVELINQGTKDLLRLQELLKNLVKLEMPNRMFMDSRITNK